jgi:hypothetical protein
MINSVNAVGSSATSFVPWPTVGTDDLDALAKARTQAINLVQWLARIANSYVTEGPPERRTELEFRASAAALFTKPFDKSLALEMRLPSLEMQFIDNGNPVPHILDPEEHTPAEIEAWILVELLHRGVDRDKFFKKLPYTIPGLMSGDAEDHSPQSCQQGLTQLIAWFQNAAAVLSAASRDAGAADVRIVCLPQTLNLKCISGAGMIQADIGFSPGDMQNPEPFFYANSGASIGSAEAKSRSVLKASKLLAERDPAAAALKFLKPITG